MLFDPVVITWVFTSDTGRLRLFHSSCSPKVHYAKVKLQPMEAVHHSFLSGGHGLFTPVLT